MISINMLSWKQVVIGCVSAFALAAAARAEQPESAGGAWRADLEAARETRSGKGDREGDSFVAGTVEYEWPLLDRAAVGLRVRPMFVYFQDRGSDTIYGAAAGVTVRMYGRKHSRTGPFIEIGSSALWHSRHFNENGARVNFWSEGGVGYQFSSSPWYVAFKWHHMSNASLRSDNAGIDGFTISGGYRF
jgi:hypothetical protein